MTVMVMLAACGGGASQTKVETPAAAAAAKPALPAALASLAWLVGDWKDAGGGESHWTFAGDALFGVGFDKDAFVVGIITAAGERAQLRMFVNGEQGSTLGELERSAGKVSFGEAATPISFERASLQPAPAARAPALEQADLEFAEATAARGIAGWTDWFDEHGAMWRDAKEGKPGERIEGKTAIHDFMGPVLGRPGFRLEWHPLASALAPSGQLGYSVGAWEAVNQGDGGTREVKGHGAYVTVWKRQADGAWRVLFDTGDDAEDAE